MKDKMQTKVFFKCNIQMQRLINTTPSKLRLLLCAAEGERNLMLRVFYLKIVERKIYTITYV